MSDGLHMYMYVQSILWYVCQMGCTVVRLHPTKSVKHGLTANPCIAQASNPQTAPKEVYNVWTNILTMWTRKSRVKWPQLKIIMYSWPWLILVHYSTRMKCIVFQGGSRQKGLYFLSLVPFQHHGPELCCEMEDSSSNSWLPLNAPWFN